MTADQTDQTDPTAWVTHGYANALSDAVAAAGVATDRLLRAAPWVPEDRLTVVVDVDEDTERPGIDLSIDNTDGTLNRFSLAGLPEVLGLELNESAPTWREWTARVNGRDVSLIVYLEGAAPSRWQRARAFLGRYPGAEVALIGGAGALAALAARRAILALVR